MNKPTADFIRILEVLVTHDVAFLIVGGVGAVLQGAPLSTFDLDIVHARDERNIKKMIAALKTLNASYRGRSGRRIAPGTEQLSSPGHHLLMTDAGPLDVLGSIGDDQSYRDLLPDSIELALSEDTSVRVLSLRALIRLKEKLGREKDRAALAVLRRTLAEQNRK
jgi:hypothetical protein